MAFLDSHSCECVKSELDLFSIPPTQTSIESSAIMDFLPISSIGHMLPIEFIIGGSGSDYVDLSSLQLHLKVQILTAAGANIAPDAQVGPINLLMQTLFSEVEITLGDKIVSSTNNMYMYRAYLETLLTYGQGAKKSQLSSGLFFKDSPGHMDAANAAADDCANSGLKTRRAFTTESKVLDLMGRLHCDLVFQDKLLPADVGLKIKLMRNKDAFVLMSSTPAQAYKLHVVDVKLLLRKVKVSPSVQLAHAEALQHSSAKLPIKRIVTKTCTIPQGLLDYSLESLFHGQLPNRVLIGFVENAAFNGSYERNPFNFKHFNLKKIKLGVDGHGMHVREIETDYQNGLYLQAYNSLFSGTGINYDDQDIDITRLDYSGGNSLYIFDLSPDQNCNSGSINLLKEGTVRLNVQFNVALPQTVNAIVYAEFDNIIEIDRLRNVIIDYNS